MAMTGRTSAAAVFDKREDAEKAVEELRSQGFGEAELGEAYQPATANQKATLRASLQAISLPENEVRYCEERFGEGCSVVTVRTYGRYEEAIGILRRHGGGTANVNLPTRDEYRPVERTAGTTSRNDLTMDRQEGFPHGEGQATSGPRADAGQGWKKVKDRYHQEWERRSQGSGRRWNYEEPGYHYGFAVAHDQRYRGRSWDELEPELQRAYDEWAHRAGYHEEEHGWDRARDNARFVWESETKGS
jgi:hypothetical protein